jgi:hypothetical protein
MGREEPGPLATGVLPSTEPPERFPTQRPAGHKAHEPGAPQGPPTGRRDVAINQEHGGRDALRDAPDAVT